MSAGAWLRVLYDMLFAPQAAQCANRELVQIKFSADAREQAGITVCDAACRFSLRRRQQSANPRPKHSRTGRARIDAQKKEHAGRERPGPRWVSKRPLFVAYVLGQSLLAFREDIDRVLATTKEALDPRLSQERKVWWRPELLVLASKLTMNMEINFSSSRALYHRLV